MAVSSVCRKQMHFQVRSAKTCRRLKQKRETQQQQTLLNKRLVISLGDNHTLSATHTKERKKNQFETPIFCHMKV